MVKKVIRLYRNLCKNQMKIVNNMQKNGQKLLKMKNMYTK